MMVNIGEGYGLTGLSAYLHGTADTDLATPESVHSPSTVTVRGVGGGSVRGVRADPILLACGDGCCTFIYLLPWRHDRAGTSRRHALFMWLRNRVTPV